MQGGFHSLIERWGASNDNTMQWSNWYIHCPKQDFYDVFSGPRYTIVPAREADGSWSEPFAERAEWREVVGYWCKELRN